MAIDRDSNNNTILVDQEVEILKRKLEIALGAIDHDQRSNLSTKDQKNMFKIDKSTFIYCRGLGLGLFLGSALTWLVTLTAM